MSDVIYLDPEDPRRCESPAAKFEILEQHAVVLVDGLMPLALARKLAAIVDRYNAGEVLAGD